MSEPSAPVAPGINPGPVLPSSSSSIHSHSADPHTDLEDVSRADDAEERRLVRKIDWILMPILTVTLGLQYYDKAVLGNAAVFGILQDLDLIRTVDGVASTARYSTATAAFYWGYIVAVLPMALIFARAPLAKACALVVLLWGIVCILTVVCHNYEGFVAQRFFLGLMESAVSPAFVTVTTLWYKPSEQAVRMGIWYSATGLFSMISGVINYGLGHNTLPKQWQALYYFCGSVTIAWSLPIYFLMPASPLDPGRFFNAREREILVRRFRENPLGRDRQPFKLEQFKEALVDWKTGVYFLMASAIYICNGAITAFGARIINGFGYTPLETTALLIPGGAVTCVTIYLFTFLASRLRDARTYMLALSCVPIIVGAVTIWTAPWIPTAGPLIGYYLVASFGAPYVLLLSVAAANTAGSTKKATVSGVIFVGYNVGNIIAAYTVIAAEVRIKYRSTWIAVITAISFTIVASFALRLAFARENRKRAAADAALAAPARAPTDTPAHPAQQTEAGSEKQGELDDGQGGVEGVVLKSLEAYRDRTDREIPGFRYVL